MNMGAAIFLCAVWRCKWETENNSFPYIGVYCVHSRCIQYSFCREGGRKMMENELPLPIVNDIILYYLTLAL